jgi:23S rRNA (uracil1939-C5)-methyltransferase
MAHEGYGFTRLPDGRALFVPFSLPGETIEVRVIREKKTHAFAQPIGWTCEDPARLKPRCRHFGVCGGCHYQHIPYELQPGFKQRIFRETFERIAGFETPKEIDIIPSPLTWNYRNTLQFRLSQEGRLCFADWLENELFEVEECLLPMPVIERAWRELDFDSLSADRVELRQNQDGDLMIVLHGGADNLPELETETTASIVHLNGQDQVVLAGEGHLTMRVHERDFQVSGGAFFQTNFTITESLVDAVTGLAEQSGCRTLIDLYSGVGLFSAFLADKAEHITAIESSALACEDYSRNLDEFEHIDLYIGKVEHVLPHLDISPDCVILDPPRAGMNAKAAEALLKLAPSAIIYVSCNPATLARDAKKMATSGYTVESVLLLDMFPQTYHVESVCLFLKKDR